MQDSRPVMVILGLLLMASAAMAQQEYVGHYDAYAGFMYLSSPAINLGEEGYHFQVGMRPTNWYSLGFDFSDGMGDTALTPNIVKSSLQQLIAEKLAPLYAAGLPSTYVLRVPLASTSRTYAAGPQFSYRHFKSATIFFRPDLGAINEAAVAHPVDDIGKALVAQLAPSGTKTDWTEFYGFGGGVDVNVMKNFSIRLQGDFVHDHLFSDILNSRNSFRFSIGPGAQWGKNRANCHGLLVAHCEP